MFWELADSEERDVPDGDADITEPRVDIVQQLLEVPESQDTCKQRVPRKYILLKYLSAYVQIHHS